MESCLQASSELGYPMDSSDAKHVSGLSTILVATIQEAKDRISQIEFIFCNQLYPNIQSKYNKMYSDARKAAEETWKDKEKEFILQIEKVLEENKSLKTKKENIEVLLDSKSSSIVDNDKLMKEITEKNSVLELEIEALKLKINKKSKENDVLAEQQSKYLQLVQSKVGLLAKKEMELKEKEELTAALLVKFEKIRKELGEKSKQIDREKEIQENLLKKIVDNDGLEYKFDELQKEKRVLISKLRSLEEKIDELQVKNREKSNEAYELHKHIDFINSELVSEKKKTRDLLEIYKKTKHQYQFLCKQMGLTTENMRTDNESNFLKLNQSPLISPGIEHKIPNPSPIPWKLTKTSKNQDGPVHQIPNLDKKPIPLSGTKRPGSNWVDTRSHQSRNGPDPHDDFLDTPLENIKGNLNFKKPAKETSDRTPVRASPDANLGSSDDETQDIGLDMGRQNTKMVPPRVGTSGYKFVEPVRKKVEREILKGIECNQCKKFYDAVLPDGGGECKDVNSRCEHHDGVSRHRYRFAPPLTPEGFWNIGFESEM
jgi:splicing factor 4